MNSTFMVKYILNGSGLSEQAAMISKRKLSSTSNSQLQNMVLLSSTYEKYVSLMGISLFIVHLRDFLFNLLARIISSPPSSTAGLIDLLL